MSVHDDAGERRPPTMRSVRRLEPSSAQFLRRTRKRRRGSELLNWSLHATRR